MRTLSIRNIRTAVIAAALAVAFVSPALHAQIPPTRTLVNIPFAFEVGSVHFAAGRYILSDPREYLLAVQGGARSALAMTWHETSPTPASISKVIFYRYGNQYFLREVWTRGKVDYLTCPESKAEQEVKRHLNADERASLTTPSRVEIALLQSPR